MAGLGIDSRHLTDNDIQRIGERTRRSILQLIKVEKGIICFCEHTKFFMNMVSFKKAMDKKPNDLKQFERS